MDGLKARQNNRPYTRGVHKGTRIDARDYAWPEEFNLWTGLQMEAAGIKFFPPGLLLNDGLLPHERYPTDRKVGPRGVPGGQRYPGIKIGSSPDRRPVLAGQAPPYSTGVRGNPGMSVPYPGR